MATTDKVQAGSSTTGTSASTSYTYSYPEKVSPPPTEYGWACPRCNRINAPWVRQCDCSRNDKWDITWCKDDSAMPWWYDYKVKCNGTSAQAQIDSETFKIHPDATTYVGGSDYWDPHSNSYTNVNTCATNTIHNGKSNYKE